MGFRCGIVGLPNVGKSTLFNALTRAGVDAANYPFCTIDPNVGVVEVPDPRLHRVADIVKPGKVVPTIIEFVDIAGLVAGASQGEGLGNRFLAHIREVDAIAHVVRAFEDSNVVHVSRRVDPLADIETINTELALADLETVARALTRAHNASKAGDKQQIRLAALLGRVQNHLDDARPVRTLGMDDDERKLLKPLCLLTAKPVMYIANTNEDDIVGNEHTTAIRTLAEREGAELVIVCAAIEAELSELDETDRQSFLLELGLREAGLDQVIRAGYRLLELHTFFTAGPKEVRAWTVRIGASAPEAAGVIHTDFQRGFIRAEIVSYDDFIGYGGELGAKEAGRLRLEGKGYIIRDGDVVHFRFNV